MRKHKIVALAASAMVFAGAAPAFAAETDKEATENPAAVEQQDVKQDKSAKKDSKQVLSELSGIKKSDSQSGISVKMQTAPPEENLEKLIPVTSGTVKHIIISGNKEIPADTFLKLVTHTKVGEEYSKKAVIRDVQAIANTGLTQSTRVATMVNNGELYVVFKVKELAEVQSVSFTGNTLISSEELQKDIATQKGEKFAPRTARDDMDRIRNAYGKLGYIAVVSGVNNDDGAVTFDIREAKVDGIIYKGNKKTKSWVLDKLVSPFIKSGDFLRNDKLQGVYSTLASSGYFSNVKIDVADVPGKPGNVALMITVKETSTGAWNIGGAYSDTYGAEAVGGIYDKNLGGSARSLNLDFGIGTERDHYSLTYTNPYWRRSDTSVYVKGFKTDKDIDNDYFKYTENHAGGEVGFTKPVSQDKKTSMYANFRVDNVKVKEQEKGPLLDSIQENSVTLGVIYNGRTAYGEGSVFEGAVTSSLTALGSDEDFTKVMLNARSYKKLSRRDTLAGRAEFNFSPDNLPRVEQFTIGGSDTVRGLEEDSQRGDQSILGTIELRHDFNDTLQGVAFVDAGKAWSDDVHNDLKIASGLGLRIKTALGVLRLDAAKSGGNDIKYLFGIGQSF